MITAARRHRRRWLLCTPWRSSSATPSRTPTGGIATMMSFSRRPVTATPAVRHSPARRTSHGWATARRQTVDELRGPIRTSVPRPPQHVAVRKGTSAPAEVSMGGSVDVSGWSGRRSTFGSAWPSSTHNHTTPPSGPSRAAGVGSIRDGGYVTRGCSGPRQHRSPTRSEGAT